MEKELLDSMIDSIKSVLNEKKERIIIDMYIRNYDYSNFYFALVFNKKISKYKVLFVPLDAVEDDGGIDEYFCYQFVLVRTAKYIMEELKKSFKKSEDLKEEDIDDYYIEINSYVGGNNKLTFTQYIDKKYNYLFDIISTLFEYSPNIVYELCPTILKTFTSDNLCFHYNKCLNCSLSNALDYFDKDIIKNCSYDLDDVEYLEDIGNSYYGVVGGHFILIESVDNEEIFNIASLDIDPLGEEVYIMIKAIEEELYRDFNKLLVVDNPEYFDYDYTGDYYLCYGIDADKFKIIDSTNSINLPLSLIEEKKVKAISYDDEFKDLIKEYLSNKYDEDKINDLLDFVFEEEEDDE